MTARSHVAPLGIGVVCLMLAAGGPALAQAPGPADPTGLQRSAITIAGVRYVLLLPKAARVDRLGEGDGRVVIMDLSKSQRLERTLVFADAPSRDAAGYDRSTKLASGHLLRYRVRDDIGGGSGGPIAELAGRVEVGPRTLSVTCTDQGELFRAPAWCVAYLHHLIAVEPR